MSETVDEETTDLVQRWIVAFCEMPVLIDADLMRAVLNDLDHKGMDR